jgi:hypothetical protein
MIYMKKLIAIAVVFVLAVGVAFAADFGAEVIGAVKAINGNTEKDSEVQAGGAQSRVRVAASGQNDEGTFGAWSRFEVYGFGGNPGLAGYAWWQPHDIFRLTIGTNPDGFFGADGVARWNFYQVAGDAGIAVQDWSDDGTSASFYGGFGGNGAILTLTPIEPLAINVAIPFIDAEGEAKNVYKQLVGQVAYNLGSVGKVALTYRGNLNDTGNVTVTGTLDGDDEFVPGAAAYKLGANGSKLFAFFGITAIENLEIDLGLGYTMPVTVKKVNVTQTVDGKKVGDETVERENVIGYDKKDDIIYKAPVAVGLGVNFTTGALGIKARFQGQFGESLSGVGGMVTKGTLKFLADLMPSFAVTDKVSAYLDTGLVMSKDQQEVAKVVNEAVVGWHIMPYVTVKASWWAPNFYAGFRIDSDGGKDPVVNWSVPIGVVFAF